MYIKFFRGEKKQFSSLPAPQGLDLCLQCVEAAAAQEPQCSGARGRQAEEDRVLAWDGTGLKIEAKM